MRSPLLAALLLSTALPAAAKKPTPADAKAFAAQLNVDLKKLLVRQATADWINQNFITDDTERNSTYANEDLLGYQSRTIKDSVKFSGLKLDPDTARALYLLRFSNSLNAPSDPAKRSEVATLSTKMIGLYGKGKYCGNPAGSKPCKTLQELSNVIATSRKPDELLDAWTGWHAIGRDLRPLYQRFVELSNEGAREIEFKDTGEMWRSAYDMPPGDFEKETERLWQEVRPLYEQLHCYVRARLQKTYGKDKVPDGAPIPAHLLGNMWAQEWGEVYPLVEPYPGQGASLDVTAALKKQGYDEIKMAKRAEAFFASLGLEPLPPTFWERSLFKRPRDREVVCHASAWDVSFEGDTRIKMCIEVKESDFETLHHELGHDHYYLSYHTLPVLFQQGANDGFHEAIGDALTLSITPSYLKQLNLVPEVPKDRKGLVNVQLKLGLTKIALLPWTKMIDQWRWDVFSGKTPPARYNTAWWELRKRYQGLAPPVPRSEQDFDPGAKYHVPANVPYTRYFLALILQFQFHKAMCDAAGFKGPLHECSIYGNKEAGKRLHAMLAMGASRPWPDALEVMTGGRKLDAKPLLDYFAPLAGFLKEQNAGNRCGW